MKLFLVQHGEAQGKDVDPERPLTPKGHDDVNKMAQFLKQSAVQVEQVIHSGKLRARQTAEVFANTIAVNHELHINENINPNDTPKVLAQQIESWQQDTLVVGHLPYMAKMISCLLIENEDLLLTAFQPGTVVCMEKNNDMQWQINWMLRPELINNKNEP